MREKRLRWSRGKCGKEIWECREDLEEGERGKMARNRGHKTRKQKLMSRTSERRKEKGIGHREEKGEQKGRHKDRREQKKRSVNAKEGRK